MRVVIAVIGCILATYGGWLALSRQDTGQLIEIGVWLVVGVLAHDVVIAGVVLVVALLARRLLPPVYRTPAAIGLILWGAITLAVVPVLGRFGARSDNPTLLDRPYLISWLVLTAISVTVVVLVSVWRASRRPRDQAVAGLSEARAAATSTTGSPASPRRRWARVPPAASGRKN